MAKVTLEYSDGSTATWEVNEIGWKVGTVLYDYFERLDILPALARSDADD